MEQSEFFDALADLPNQRSARFDDLEVSATTIEGQDGCRLEGHAAIFDEVADFGDWMESIERGAFRKVLSQKTVVPLLHEHDRSKLLATTRTGRLRLEEDTKGLKVEADIVDTPLSREIRALAQAGELRGMSFGFIAGRGNARIEEREGKPWRRLQNFSLLTDVSTTWEPAYAGAEAQFRSLALQYADSPDSLQELLRGAYPQPEDAGDEPGRGDEESRMVLPRLAAAKRQLAVMSITLEGESDA